MRKVIVLAIAALIAAATVGCECCAPLRRGAMFPPMQSAPPMQAAPMTYGGAVYESGTPCEPSCSACGPAGSAIMGAPVLTTPGTELIPGPTN